MAYYPEFPDDARKNGNNRNSFYSGHVATCAYSSYFMAKVYCDYHPEIRAGKYLLYAAAFIPPLFMAFARTKSLDHFPSDDAAGLVLGAALGIIIPQLHQYPGSKVLSFSMFSFPLATGLSARLKLPDHRHLASGRKYKQD